MRLEKYIYLVWLLLLLRRPVLGDRGGRSASSSGRGANMLDPDTLVVATRYCDPYSGELDVASCVLEIVTGGV